MALPQPSVRWALATAGGIVFVAVWVVAASVAGSAELSDVSRYGRYADAMVAGDLPYRDVEVEYPPGALGVFLAPRALEGVLDYRTAFHLLLALTALALVATTVRHLRRIGSSWPSVVAAATCVALAPLLLRQAGVERYDLVPAFLAVAAIALVAAGRNRAGGAALGAAIAVKLFPLVLAPVTYLYIRRRRGSREAAVTMVVAAAVVLASMAPFVALAPDELRSSLEEQIRRPLQLESLGASVLLVGEGVGLTELDTVVSSGSVNLAGDAVGPVEGASKILVAAALGLVWLVFARGRRGEREYVVASACSVAAVVALGVVLSPQFVLWVLAPTLLALGAGVVAPLAALAAVGLTALLYPSLYLELIRFEPAAVLLLAARNAALLATLFLLLRALSRGSG